MKLSKSILQAVFVGMTLGATVTSCTVVETIEEINEELVKLDPDAPKSLILGEGESCTTDWGNCPACGMG